MSNINDDDDDFGGFEEAVNTNVIQSTASPSYILNETSSREPPSNVDRIPDWVLGNLKPVQQLMPKKSQSESLSSGTFDEETSTTSELINHLQEELSKTKEALIDQQTSFLQLQAQHRQDLDEKTTSFNSSIVLVYKEFTGLLKQSLLQQREVCLKEFKTLLDKQSLEQEKTFHRKSEEMQKRYQDYYSEKFEAKLVDFQENLIKLNKSEFEDTEIKIKKVVQAMFKEEKLNEKQSLLAHLDRVKIELKQENEKSINQHFISHSESFKEQIKSGVMQEHLIHKDLINSKLEKLFKSSEEKRRHTNVLFQRHLGGLNFFISNANKQMGLLKEAHTDLLKNKYIVDFYGGGQSSDASHSQDNSEENLFIKEVADDLLIDTDLLV